MVGLWGSLFLFSIFGLFAINSQNATDSDEGLETPSRDGSESCTENRSRPLSPEEKNYLIWFHRSLRENVSKQASERLPKAFFIKNLTWDNRLEEMARAHERGDVKDVDLNENIGRNVIEYNEDSGTVKLQDLLQIWVAGLRELTPDIIAKYRKAEKHEHNYEPITQILWWNTERFGCGKLIHKQKCISDNNTAPEAVVKIICNYSPGGNKIGEPVYISEKNKGLICKYDPRNSYCTLEKLSETRRKEILVKVKTAEEEVQRTTIEYRIRSRMIELWPAAGSQTNVWHMFNKYFFCLSLIVAILPYLNTSLNVEININYL